MPGNSGHHSKGKGKEKEKEKTKDVADSLGELSLEDSAARSIPRNGQPSHQYDQPNYPRWEDYPTDNVGFTYQTNGYGDHSTTTGRGPSYDSNYAPFSYASSSSYASSYTPSIYAASSYAASVSTVQSSDPPRSEPHNLNHHIAQQQPTRNRYELPCEFRDLTDCPVRFRDGEEDAWKAHHEKHLNHKFPTKLRCWFCDTYVFDSTDPKNIGAGGDKPTNFRIRMNHIREHILGDGYGASHMRLDGGLLQHLRRERVISSQEYDSIIRRTNPTTAPPIPGSRSSRLSEHVEEVASSSKDRRHEKKDKHDSLKKKHKR